MTKTEKKFNMFEWRIVTDKTRNVVLRQKLEKSGVKTKPLVKDKNWKKSDSDINFFHINIENKSVSSKNTKILSQPISIYGIKSESIVTPMIK